MIVLSLLLWSLLLWNSHSSKCLTCAHVPALCCASFGRADPWPWPVQDHGSANFKLNKGKLRQSTIDYTVTLCTADTHLYRSIEILREEHNLEYARTAQSLEDIHIATYDTSQQ